MNEILLRRKNKVIVEKGSVTEPNNQYIVTIMKNVEVFKERNRHELYLKDIKVIEASDSAVELLSSHGTFRKETSLSKLEEILDERFFFRISKKYIVNMRWIDEYKDGIVKVDNITMKVSIRKKKEFERRYIEYDIHFR